MPVYHVQTKLEIGAAPGGGFQVVLAGGTTRAVLHKGTEADCLEYAKMYMTASGQAWTEVAGSDTPTKGPPGSSPG